VERKYEGPRLRLAMSLQGLLERKYELKGPIPRRGLHQTGDVERKVRDPLIGR
jgi:hypothetical protein